MDLKEYRDNNPEKMLQIRKDWRDENREHIAEYTKEYQQKYPEKCNGYTKERQHKNHKITDEEWESNKKYFNHRCAYCGLAIEDHWIKHKGKFQLGDFHKEHVDHFGKNDLSNCVPSCKKCNSSKWKYKLEDWYNLKNKRFTQERLDRIYKWINEDLAKDLY